MKLETEGKVEDKTTERFEIVRKKSTSGEEFWMAKELGPELGYPIWGNFEPVLKRAVTAMKKTGVDPS
jgi:DNA-damage-inducible protein D